MTDNNSQEEEQEFTYQVPMPTATEDTPARTVTTYGHGTVRVDYKAEGLNTFIGSARARGADEPVGEPYEPDMPRKARTSHPLGWVRFGDYR